jgi:hypothetical protein
MLAGLGVARADGLDPIAVRQAGFSLQNGDFAFIRSVVAAKGDVKPLEVPARAVAKWAAVIPSMFPLALGEAATKLATDAKTGDADVVAADMKLVGEQCGACHKAYRAK